MEPQHYRTTSWNISFISSFGNENKIKAEYGGLKKLVEENEMYTAAIFYFAKVATLSSFLVTYMNDLKVREHLNKCVARY